MNFSFLKDFHQKWNNMLVIGKTIEQNGKKYHIVGMTLSDKARLYIIEPYIEPERISKKGIRNHRMILKEQNENSCHYLHCSEFCLGNERMQVHSALVAA